MGGKVDTNNDYYRLTAAQEDNMKQFDCQSVVIFGSFLGHPQKSQKFQGRLKLPCFQFTLAAIPSLFYGGSVIIIGMAMAKLPVPILFSWREKRV